MATIFANGFEFGTDEKALREHFEGVGEIKTFHWQSRGGAVITYVNESSAARAVSELHETTMKGQSRYVAVKLDDPDRAGGKGKDDRPPLRGKGGGKGGKGGGGASGRTVFVNGFSFDTDEAAVQKHFGKVGAIETLHFQSKGSVVVTYEKAATARQAVEILDGSYMEGQDRYVAVKLDDPDRSKGGYKGDSKGSSKGGGKRSGKSPATDTGGRGVYVSGFDFDTDDAKLKKHFGHIGTIEDIYFQSKGAAVITFSDTDAAKKALDLANTTMEGQSRYVAVKIDDVSHREDSRKGSGKGKGKWK